MQAGGQIKRYLPKIINNSAEIDVIPPVSLFPSVLNYFFIKFNPIIFT